MNDDSILSNTARLKALEQSRLMDTPPEISFDNLTREICRVLDVPISVVSLIEPDRQFFKSQQGMGDARDSHIKYSICRYVVEVGSTIVINNASIAFGLKDHAAVIEDNIQAYLGAPLIYKGHVLGSVCAADKKVRVWSEKDIKFIEEKAALANAEIIVRNDSFNTLLSV